MSINIAGVNTASAATPTSLEKVSLPAGQEVALAVVADPVIDLLKKLLPVDTPMGTILERFRESVPTTTRDLTMDQAVGRLLNLIKSLPIDLKTVTEEQLRSVVDRLGLRYEPMLQHALSQRLPLSSDELTAQNLKAALLQVIELSQKEAPTQTGVLGSPVKLSSQGPGASQEGQPQENDLITQQAWKNLETSLLKTLQAQARGLPIESNRQAGTMAAGGDSQSANLEQPLGATIEQLLQVLNRINPEGDLNLKTALVKLAETAASQSPSVDAKGALPSGITPEDVTRIAAALNDLRAQVDPRLLLQVRKAALVQLLENQTSSENGPVEGVQSGLIAAPNDYRQHAYDLLTAIERTQVLNSVNSERGEPLAFQIPFVLDGRTSTAEFYVERRLDEARQEAPEDRHYHVVALLDLSGLGALRVDLVLHRKNLSVKMTVEREETEALTRELLPALQQGLDSQGFAVERLSCECRSAGVARGEELREQTLPVDNGLINLRV